ncbi:MAG TPA: hypothetical protein VHY09_02880 [Candidatus Methylacidiphilales bacterium]|jgi:hypothetical protein|nr:hypothetical protein [Candidatus Methylacidiphilales bacterium]
MKTPESKNVVAKIALALTWDGARWPAASLPSKARAFLSAKGFSSPSLREATRLLAADAVGEMRLCWVPRLKGGDDVLAEIFAAPKGKRVPFRAVKTTRFGDVLGVVYRR